MLLCLITQTKKGKEMKETKKINGKILRNVEFIDSQNYVPKARAILETCGNLRLVGETGSGKTTLVHYIAQEYDFPLFEIVMTRDVTKWDLLSSEILKSGETQTREGIVLKWLKAEKGILYLDGFNYCEPSIMSLIEPLADFRGSVWIPELEMTFHRSEKHFLVISYNPAEKMSYSGTFLGNIATLRRFEGLIIDYLLPRDERRLIQKYCDDYDFVSKFVEIANKTRDLYKRGQLRSPLTTGNLINYARLYNEKNLAEEDIIEIASSMFSDDERDIFKRLFEETGEIDIDKIKKQTEGNK